MTTETDQPPRPAPAVGLLALTAFARTARQFAETINRAMVEVNHAARQAGQAFAEFLASWRETHERAMMQRHGRGNVAGDGTWRSDMCAAWVHDSCPLTHRCDCTCHGGTAR